MLACRVAERLADRRHAEGDVQVLPHTLDEEVSVAELLRVAKVYALTAYTFCQEA